MIDRLIDGDIGVMSREVLYLVMYWNNSLISADTDKFSNSAGSYALQEWNKWKKQMISSLRLNFCFVYVF